MDMTVATRVSAERIAAAAVRSRSVQDFIAVVGDLLCTSPLKCERIFVSLQTLHPEFRARTYMWCSRVTRTSISEWPHGLRNRPGYYDSPDFYVHRSRVEFRVRNLHELTDHPCDLYGELRADGYTDYFMVPLAFSDGTINTVSIATKLPGGFPDGELDAIRDVRNLLVIILERYATLEAVSSTLETYLGRSTAREVLRGGIRTGHGERMRAAILFADLRGFTTHSAQLGSVQTVQLLNHYFDCLVGPIEQHGGYVLKFIGDAILAFFPIDVNDSVPPNPVNAVIAIRRRLACLNSARKAQGEPPIAHGLCLHFGNVLYGNVGSSDRLDFTIIGEGVNVAERIVEATKALKRDHLVTRQFVDHFGDHGLEYFGAAHIRDSRGPVELYALLDGRVSESDIRTRSKTTQVAVVKGGPRTCF